MTFYDSIKSEDHCPLCNKKRITGITKIASLPKTYQRDIYGIYSECANCYINVELNGIAIMLLIIVGLLSITIYFPIALFIFLLSPNIFVLIFCEFIAVILTFVLFYFLLMGTYWVIIKSKIYRSYIDRKFIKSK